MNANQIPFLNKKVASGMKGLSALYIMLSHLIHSPCWQLGFFLFGGGYLFVGVFFFYSGYGLKKSCEGQMQYLNGFFKRKIVKIYLPFLLAETCYTLLMSYFSGDYSNLLLRCLGIELSNTILWYVIEILGLYTLFYFFEKHNIPMITYIMVWIVFTLIISYFNIGSWWYVSTPCFILGVFCGKYENVLHRIKRTQLKKITALTIFWGTDLLHRWISEFKISLMHIPSTYLCVALMVVSAISFIITLILVVENDFFSTRVLNYCGNLSYLIYLWHGFFILLFSRFFKSDVVLTPLVTVTTILFAVVYRQVKTRVSKEKNLNVERLI